ncbi:hypothetical protein ACFOG5_21090 [Pedobacter fastidiosus]|uniref:Uncharacterized protein n=1 Tax=Pedobacter fastidiosus TaxID=2765361 RepID=A0ABR7KNV5_9SPHI|nr:hypothetical protein [Pedobacter fastidiosus]MBC6109755.1 hypothetical protein [Pedobacter fastidiosus]
MKTLKIIITVTFLFFVKNLYSQTTILDFTRVPQTYAGDGTYNPNYFDNSGCSNKFGPNPLIVNGYNLRSVGVSNIFPVYTNTSTTYKWSLYAWGNTKTGQRCNVGISVEYPFKANKTYEIELNGVNDHMADGHESSPKMVYNGVFWIKLDDNPALVTNAPDPCMEWYMQFEKSVGRYSKLIADGVIAIENKTYRVKFSPLEAKSALKIIFDSSPTAPDIIIDNIFHLKNIKITEMPYEEEGPSYIASYTNVPKPHPWNPAYEIPGVVVRPSNGYAYPTRPNVVTPSIPTNLWTLNSDGIGYSIYLSDVISNLNVSQTIYLDLLGDITYGPRPGQQGRQSIAVPGAYQGNNYTYTTFNNDIVITVKNSTNTPPVNPIDFVLTYY